MITIESLFGVTEQILSEPILAYQCEGSVFAKHTDHITAITETIRKPLPFTDFQFSYALSSAPFFKENQDSETILIQLRELVRVAKEVRLAPYTLAQTHVMEQVGPVMLALQQDNIGVEITPLQAATFGQAVRIKLWAQACRLS
ncbi:MAG: hypothetical protein NTW08_08235 [Gammaproteobacteria bacterium]|nr:hypothetical protein [Gammaproteobacteria bacterium]